MITELSAIIICAYSHCLFHSATICLSSAAPAVSDTAASAVSVWLIRAVMYSALDSSKVSSALTTCLLSFSSTLESSTPASDVIFLDASRISLSVSSPLSRYRLLIARSNEDSSVMLS